MPTGGTIPVGSQLDHAFPAPDGSSGVTKGHQPGRFRIREDDSGVCRTPEDTPATRFGTVRTRVQIPRPRPFLYSKSAILEVVWSRRITGGSQFPAERQNRGGVTVPVVGQREIAGRRPVATQRPKPADAQGRTVRPL